MQEEHEDVEEEDDGSSLFFDFYAMCQSLGDGDGSSEKLDGIIKWGCSYCAEMDERSIEEDFGIERAEVSRERFLSEYERRGSPVVLMGLSDGDDRWWPRKAWNPDALLQEFSAVAFALNNGQKFALRDFMGYVSGRSAVDVQPLYLFDDLSLISGDSERAPIIKSGYAVPDHFEGLDLFAAPSAAQLKDCGAVRPRWRWFLIGPARSGTVIHTDPFATSAWNTLLVGKKHWIILPPDTPKEVIKPEGYKESDGAVCWMKHVLPKVKEYFCDEYAGSGRMIDFMQRPGETVFVPSGWWHIVVNVSTTVAVTQNFASRTNLGRIRKSLAKENPAFGRALELVLDP